MIKKDYLSEVEALYVAQQALIGTDSLPTLFVVWADVGQEVHGFVARTDSITPSGSGWVVQFTPACDITVLRPKTTTQAAWTDDDGVTHPPQKFVSDPRKRSSQDLLWMLTNAAGKVDEDLICDQEPTIGEDVTVTS